MYEVHSLKKGGLLYYYSSVYGMIFIFCIRVHTLLEVVKIVSITRRLSSFGSFCCS